MMKVDIFVFKLCMVEPVCGCSSQIKCLSVLYTNWYDVVGQLPFRDCFDVCLLTERAVFVLFLLSVKKILSHICQSVL